MSLANIVAFVQTTLEGIPGIGLVHPFQPVMTDAGQIPSLMGTPGDIRFWSISRESTSENRLSNHETERHHILVIRGYLEVGDPSVSEPLFQALIEAIMLTFRGIYQIGTSGIDAEIAGPLDTTQIGRRILGQTILVHYCECRLAAHELVTP